MNDNEPYGDTVLPDFLAGIAASELPDGRTLLGTVNGTKVLLARVRGQVFAVGATCTHLGGPLAKGVLVEGEIRCPWHHARFDVGTGEAVGAPAFEPLARFAVEQRDGRIYVTGRQPDVPPERIASQRNDQPPPERIVIVGGGAAGFACAEMLARGGFGSRVTILSADSDLPYDRTFCSKAYLAGQAERQECMLASADFFGANGPRLVRTRVQAIDIEARRVVAENGEHHAFDALVIATGAEPRRPELPGSDGAVIHVLRTLADADALIAAAQRGQHAAVMGAGFIGLEVAASLTQRGVEVAVVAPDDVPLARIVGSEIGQMIRSVHELHSVHFRLGRKAVRYADGRLVLDDGSTIEAGFVVAGIGVAPRIELARAAGLQLASDDAGGGIVVNARLETSAPGIFAAGDVANYPDLYSDGRHIRVEHWVHAERQGQHVARVLMGRADIYPDIPFFWSAHFDVKLRYLGHATKVGRTEVDGNIAVHDFAARLHDGKGGEAFVSCNRDRSALEEEVHRRSAL